MEKEGRVWLSECFLENVILENVILENKWISYLFIGFGK